MLRNLATSIILYEKVKTTPAKAKEVRRLVEKMINLGKRKDLAARKILFSFFPDKNAARKIYQDLAPRLRDTKSGFIRMAKLGYRMGDAAPQVLIELVVPTKEPSPEETKVKVTTKVKEPGESKEKPKLEAKEEKKEKKGWLERVKEVGKLPKITGITKKITTKRTTSK
jgi:large subunit ribosomal protein L17